MGMGVLAEAEAVRMGLAWPGQGHSDRCLLASVWGRNRKQETGHMEPYASTNIGMPLVLWLLEPEVQELSYPKFCHLHEEMLAIQRATQEPDA